MFTHSLRIRLPLDDILFSTVDRLLSAQWKSFNRGAHFQIVLQILFFRRVTSISEFVQISREFQSAFFADSYSRHPKDIERTIGKEAVMINKSLRNSDVVMIPFN